MEITKGFTAMQILMNVLLYTNNESCRQITVLFCGLVYVPPVQRGTRMRKPQLRPETEIQRKHESAVATHQDTSHTKRAGLQSAINTYLRNIFISLLSLALQKQEVAKSTAITGDHACTQQRNNKGNNIRNEGKKVSHFFFPLSLPNQVGPRHCAEGGTPSVINYKEEQQAKVERGSRLRGLQQRAE